MHNFLLIPGVYYSIFNKNDNALSHLYNSGQILGHEEELVLLRLGAQRLLLLDQQHSDIAYYVDKNYSTVQGDAMVSDVSGLVLGIKTADCVCVLLSTLDGKAIAAAHVGWRGAASNLLYNTIELIKKISTDQVCAFISPSIRQASYAVDQRFYDNFLAIKANSKEFFLHQNQRLFFDLPGFVKRELTELGVDFILDSNMDTYNSDDYFSFRFSAHCGLEEKRRNLFCIVKQS
jgi:YfiH family protein